MYLQEPSSMIGEVVKVMGKTRVLVKVRIIVVRWVFVGMAYHLSTRFLCCVLCVVCVVGVGVGLGVCVCVLCVCCVCVCVVCVTVCVTVCLWCISRAETPHTGRDRGKIYLQG
jgi:hypothetical protein